MNYTLLPQDASKTIQEQILFNRGIQDAESYLNANEKDIYHWSFLDNMQLAVETVQNCIVNGQDIAIISDSDADGCLSSSMLYNYLKKIESVFIESDSYWFVISLRISKFLVKRTMYENELKES